MALPQSRNTNYAPGLQVESADLNKIQDCIVERLHGDVVVTFGLGAATGPGADKLTQNLYFENIPFGQILSCWLSGIPDGTSVVAGRVRLRDSAGVGEEVICALQQITESSSTTIGNATFSDLSGADQWLNLDIGGSPHALVPELRYRVSFRGNVGSTNRFYWVELTIRKE